MEAFAGQTKLSLLCEYRPSNHLRVVINKFHYAIDVKPWHESCQFEQAYKMNYFDWVAINSIDNSIVNRFANKNNDILRDCAHIEIGPIFIEII